MKLPVKFFAFLAVVLLVQAGCSRSTPSGFPERDIEVIIPFDAGGGFDTYVRALAPHIERHLSNNVNVLPINVPGAGGRRGTSDIFRAQPDGYTIGVFNMPGVLIPQLQGVNVGYDLSKVTWLATLSRDGYAIIVRKDSPLNSIDDVKNMDRPIVYGATGPSSTSYIATTITSEALGIPYEVVTGYKGSSEYIIGVIRGDIDAAFANLSTVRSYLESGDVKMIALIGEDSDDPAVSDASGLGIPELSNISVVRMMGAPPGLPEDIRSTLESAITAALEDPAFHSWLESTANDVYPASAAETADLIAGMSEFYEKFKDFLE